MNEDGERVSHETLRVVSLEVSGACEVRFHTSSASFFLPPPPAPLLLTLARAPGSLPVRERELVPVLGRIAEPHRFKVV